jgi:hypothetical protein
LCALVTDCSSAMTLLTLSMATMPRLQTQDCGRRRRWTHRSRCVECSAAANLPLAARRRVGHIGLVGDVAEWLKAAVC